MPIYEYECPKCGKFEAMQKFSDKPLKANPDCTDKACPKKATKLVSASAFHLKGTGWYKTDYASSGSGSAASASAGAGATGTDATKPASTEAKPAAEKTSEKSSKKEGKAAKD